MATHSSCALCLCAASISLVDAVILTQQRVHSQAILSDSDTPSHKFAWFHAPKTGTSFGATLMHYANSSLPADEGAKLLGHWAPFWRKYPINIWFKDGLWKEHCDHARVTEQVYRSYQGRFVGLFREPKSRMISAYFGKGGGKGDILHYAQRAEGTATMQLAGQDVGEKWLYWPGDLRCGGYKGARFDEEKPVPDINLALSRLRDGFMFVGLSEEYDLSVCLFHAMFGGECLPVEFQNMRPGHKAGVADIDRQLEGYSDAVDGELYGAASQMFWESVKMYNVSRSSCLNICPRAGEIFAPSLSARLAELGSANESDYEYHWPDRYCLHDPDDEELFEHVDTAGTDEEKLVIGK